jgi:transposase
MMGIKTFRPKGVYHLDWDQRIPPHHLLRRVAEVVDFAFVRQQTARFYSHTGKPSVDPVVLVKLALLGYLYGITSERRLAEEVRLNLAFRWFLGYDLDEPTPDHSVLSKARRRFGVTVSQAFFTEIVRQCQDAGLIAGDQLFADSTLVEANASLESVGSRALLEQLTPVDAYVAALWRDSPAPDEPAPAEPTPPPPDPAAAEPAGAAALPPPPAAPTAAAVAGPLGPHRLGSGDPPNGSQGPVNVLAASRTDPDAGLVSRPTVPLGLYHTVHVGVDGGRGRIITAIDVTAGEIADEHLLGRLCREHQGNTGVSLAEVIADTKYGTIANYRWLEAQGIRASIPPHENAWADRTVPRELFVYASGADRYRCPNGQPLTRQGSSRTAHPMGAVIYRASPKVCGACPHKAACCGEAKARTITRPNDGGLAERVRAHLATRPAKRSLRRRLSWAETPMAELKERHGCRRAQRRGRDQVRIQALGAAMAYTIKKLAQASRPQPQSSALAGQAGPGRLAVALLTVRHARCHRLPATGCHWSLTCRVERFYRSRLSWTIGASAD